MAECLALGRYGDALQIATAPDASTDLVDLELTTLTLYASARRDAARSAAEQLLASAEAQAAAVGPARRILAERLWDIDLRRNYEQVRRLLAPEDDPVDLDAIEHFRRRVLMGDFAQCRGQYDLAARCLEEAAQLAAAVTDEDDRTACLAEFELAHCRNLQGRDEFDAALESIGRGLAYAEAAKDNATWLRLMIRRTRTLFMINDQDAGRSVLAEAVAMHDTCVKSGVTSWDSVWAELAFAQGELALYGRRPVTAERLLREAAKIDSATGSHEAFVESAVLLTASLIMQDRPTAALDQYARARELCADQCYADLSGDLDRLAESRRFRKMSGMIQREGSPS